MTDTWVIVPARNFAHAKQRLAPALDADDRASLARAMLANVVGVAAQHGRVSGVVVATDADEVELFAREHGALVRRDQPGDTLARAVDGGVAAAAALGATSALILMADLPRLGACDIDAALRYARPDTIIGAPDHRGTCTNALVLPVLDVPFVTSFRGPGSFVAHRDSARRRGLTWITLARPTLAWDVDVPGDLAPQLSRTG